MIKSLIKIFHLPTDTLRIISTSFSSRLNDQSIKETRLKIARILNWAESEVLISLALLSRFKFGALPRTYDLFIVSLNRPSIQLNIHTTENRANTELGWERGFISFSSRCSADLDSERFHEHTSLRHDLLTAFLNRPSIQLNIHTTKNYGNTKLN